MAFLNSYLRVRHHVNILRSSLHSLPLHSYEPGVCGMLDGFPTSKTGTRKYQTSRKSHYDVLEITPKATQAQVKAAYYKMSLEHHPDQSGGDPEKFRMLTDAYDILKSVRKRNLYDKGFYRNNPASKPAPAREAKPTSTPRSQQQTSREVYTGRIPGVYDFDAWLRAHYSQQREARVMGNRRRLLREKMMKEQKESEEKTKVVVVVGLMVACVFMVADSLVAAAADRPTTR